MLLLIYYLLVLFNACAMSCLVITLYEFKEAHINEIKELRNLKSYIEKMAES